MDKATPTPSPASVDSAPPLRFRFIEFNARRAMRGAEAARVAVIDGDDEDWLWMSQRDIAQNMMLHGRCEELLKAHDAYKENAHA